MKATISSKSFTWKRPTIISGDNLEWSLGDGGEWKSISTISSGVLTAFKSIKNSKDGKNFYHKFGPLTREQLHANRFTWKELHDFKQTLFSNKKNEIEKCEELGDVYLIGTADPAMTFYPSSLADYMRCVYQEKMEEKRIAKSNKDNEKIEDYKVCQSPECTKVLPRKRMNYCKGDKCRQDAKRYRDSYALQEWGLETWGQAEKLAKDGKLEITEADRSAAVKKFYINPFKDLTAKDSEHE